jgi:hypothetical protein
MSYSPPFRSLQNPYQGIPGAQPMLTPQENKVFEDASITEVRKFFSGCRFMRRPGSISGAVALVAEMELGPYPEDIMQSWGKICSKMKKEGVNARMTTQKGQAYFIIPLAEEEKLRILLDIKPKPNS